MMNFEPQKRPGAFELLEDPFLLDHAQVETSFIFTLYWNNNSIHDNISTPCQLSGNLPVHGKVSVISKFSMKSFNSGGWGGLWGDPIRIKKRSQITLSPFPHWRDIW